MPRYGKPVDIICANVLYFTSLILCFFLKKYGIMVSSRHHQAHSITKVTFRLTEHAEYKARLN